MGVQLVSVVNLIVASLYMANRFVVIVVVAFSSGRFGHELCDLVRAS